MNYTTTTQIINGEDYLVILGTLSKEKILKHSTITAYQKTSMKFDDRHKLGFLPNTVILNYHSNFDKTTQKLDFVKEPHNHSTIIENLFSENDYNDFLLEIVFGYEFFSENSRNTKQDYQEFIVVIYCDLPVLYSSELSMSYYDPNIRKVDKPFNSLYRLNGIDCDPYIDLFPFMKLNKHDFYLWWRWPFDNLEHSNTLVTLYCDKEYHDKIDQLMLMYSDVKNISYVNSPGSITIYNVERQDSETKEPTPIFFLKTVGMANMLNNFFHFVNKYPYRKSDLFKKSYLEDFKIMIDCYWENKHLVENPLTPETVEKITKIFSKNKTLTDKISSV